MTQSLAIELRDIEKKYSGRTILKDIQLSIPKGQFCALVGRNGVGKSTLMRLLMRHELPSHGTIEILGVNSTKDLADFNEHIAYVSETTQFLLPVTLKKFAKHYGKTFSCWDESLFLTALEQRGIESTAYFVSLSRGQRMQVAFAAALASRPQILLLDEITSVLDAHARKWWMDQLAAFTAKGGTVLMATNIISEVEGYADRLILLDDGKIEADIEARKIPEKFQAQDLKTAEQVFIYLTGSK